MNKTLWSLISKIVAYKLQAVTWAVSSFRFFHKFFECFFRILFRSLSKIQPRIVPEIFIGFPPGILPKLFLRFLADLFQGFISEFFQGHLRAFQKKLFSKKDTFDKCSRILLSIFWGLFTEFFQFSNFLQQFFSFLSDFFSKMFQGFLPELF